jgi:transposase
MEVDMAYYVGLDVSQKQTWICVVDEKGKVVAEGCSLTRAADVHGWLGNRVERAEIAKVGLEAGNMSSWLYSGLTKLGLPVVCLEAFQAHRFISTQRNKTDKNDARGLAQLTRMGEGFLKLVTVRSQGNQEARALLMMREHLVRQKVDLENHISGILKPFGLVVARGNVSPDTFRDRVVDALCLAEDHGVKIKAMVLPPLDLYRSACSQLAVLTKQVEAMAHGEPICRRLMTAPGVGPVIALSFYSAVDYPERFRKAEDVGAYFGLTPRQFQSGQTDYMVGISKRGDRMVRHHLVTAATVLMTATKKWCPLKAWGIKIAKKQGFSKARVAVARKLAIILHKMWISGQDFQWASVPKEELEALAAS